MEKKKAESPAMVKEIGRDTVIKYYKIFRLVFKVDLHYLYRNRGLLHTYCTATFIKKKPLIKRQSCY